MAAAQSSLPVPLSPVIKTVADDGAALWMIRVDRLHRERTTDQPAELIASEFLLEGLHRVGELAALQSVSHGHAQALARQRLDDEVKSPLAHRFDRGIDRALRGDDNHFRRKPALFDLAKDFDAVHVGEIDIQRHDIGRTVVELREGFATSLHGCRTDAFGGQIGGISARVETSSTIKTRGSGDSIAVELLASRHIGNKRKFGQCHELSSTRLLPLYGRRARKAPRTKENAAAPGVCMVCAQRFLSDLISMLYSI